MTPSGICLHCPPRRMPTSGWASGRRAKLKRESVITDLPTGTKLAGWADGVPPQPACPADLAVVVRVSSPVNSGVDEISGIERVNVLSKGTAETGHYRRQRRVAGLPPRSNPEATGFTSCARQCRCGKTTERAEPDGPGHWNDFIGPAIGLPATPVRTCRWQVRNPFPCTSEGRREAGGSAERAGTPASVCPRTALDEERKHRRQGPGSRGECSWTTTKEEQK